MKCSFCGKSMLKGRGKMLVKNSGQIVYFCGSKCDRNFAHGREGRKVKWTETSRKLRSEKAPVKAAQGTAAKAATKKAAAPAAKRAPPKAAGDSEKEA